MTRASEAALSDDLDDPLRLDRQICFPLYAATNLITRLYRPILAELGLTYSQYLVMLVLWEQAPLSVSALGERLHLDSGTLTPLLKRMETAGLVTRTRDSADERRVLIALTAKGDALREPARKVPEAMSAGMAIDPAEADDFREAVQGLVRALASRTG